MDIRAIATIVCLLTVVTAGHCLTNILENPALEVDEGGDGVADAWAADIQGGASGDFAIDRAVKHSGNASQRIDHKSDNAKWVRASQHRISATPQATYRLELWVKSDGPCRVILYEFQSGDREYLSHNIFSVKETDGWERFGTSVTTTPYATQFKVSLITNGRGTAWFDDVALLRIDERPAVRIPHSAETPKIDGEVDDECWSAVPRIERFMTLDGQGTIAAAPTTARIITGDSALYIAFECHEPNMDGLVAKATEDSAQVWGDDRVEVYLDVECRGASYVHFGVSAGGGKWQEQRRTQAWYRDWYSHGTEAGATPSWGAAAHVGEQNWCAEMRVPYKEIGAPRRPGETWCIQLCRTRLTAGNEQNSTWSYVAGEKYARPERFGKMVFRADRAASVETVEHDIDPEAEEPVIVPEPKKVMWRHGAYRFNERSRIRIASQRQEPEAELLAETLKRRYGVRLVTGTAGPPRGPGAIDLAANPGRRVPDDDEAYRLQITPEGITIEARSPRARMYAVHTLLQTIAADGEATYCRCATIIDEPTLQWRGWHTASPPTAADIPAYKNLIDVLAALKYNTIVWEVNNHLRYESRPAVARENAPTKSQLRELVQYAKKRHFRVVPQLATFSHFGYVLSTPKYRHLAESEKTTKGHRSLFNYCPSKPEVYELVFDLMEEVAGVFEPDYFHIGHDEASFDDIGVCDKCSAKKPWELWAKDITKLHDWIKKNGMRTVMWGDQFLPSHNGGEPYFTAKATDMVPKDILIYDWHYSPYHDYDATIGYFKKHGFEVVGCPWYEQMNVFDFASSAWGNDIVGFNGTTWSSVSNTPTNRPHLPAAWVIGGENTWSTDSRAPAEFPYSPVPVFNRLWDLRQPRPSDSFRLIDITAHCNEPIIDNDRHEGWMGRGPDYDLQNLPTGNVWVDDSIPFRIPRGAREGAEACIMLAGRANEQNGLPGAIYEIPVGLKAEALYFLHTCSVPKKRQRKLYETKNPNRIGRYTINYQTGERVTIPLRYQANINDWNSQRGPAQAIALWQGQTESDVLATLAAIKWENPHPELEIRSIDVNSGRAGVKPALLAVTAAGQ